ncbi:hypothetical protein ABS71_04990 [bacterium SCN 62-11]|nr:hypothetical protein [Candidatus Eremiobacteraeota bacterium]ODT74953.1 MAG: hypothetical protein ABS71_04990 [bacterium SCN 62-11]
MRKKILLFVLTLIAVPLCCSAVDDYRRFSLALGLREEADELDHQGRTEEALLRLELARQTYPDFLDIYQEMAEIHIERKEWELAYAAVDEAVRRCPPLPASQAIVYRQRGFCLARWGKLGEAAADFRTALRYDPAESLSRRLLAQASALGSQSSTLLPSGSITQAKSP